MPQQAQSTTGFGPPEDVKGFGPPETEESEHARQLTPAQPLGSLVPQGGFLQRAASAVGLPTSSDEAKGMEPSTAEVVGGPIVTAGKMAWNYGNNMVDLARQTHHNSKDAIENIQSGQPIGPNLGKIASGVTEFGLRGPLGPFGGSAIQQGGEDFEKGNNAGTAGDFAGSVINLLTLDRGIGQSDKSMANKLTFVAGKPSAEAVNATIQTLKDEAAAKTSLGKSGATSNHPPGSAGEFLGTVQSAKNKINEAYGNALGPYAAKPFMPLDPSGKPLIPARLEELKKGYMNFTDEGKKELGEIKQAQADFSKPHPLGDLDAYRTRLNTEMATVNGLTPSARYGNLGKASVGFRVDKAILDAIADAVYPEADRLAGKPRGTFEKMKQQQMNLMQIERSLETRIRDAQRDAQFRAGTPLSERMNIRGVVGERGNPRAYISNAREAVAPRNELKHMDKQTKSAFPAPWKESVASSAILSLPLRQLLLHGDSSSVLPEGHPLGQGPIQ
jgi:hypothetical protein